MSGELGDVRQVELGLLELLDQLDLVDELVHVLERVEEQLVGQQYALDQLIRVHVLVVAIEPVVFNTFLSIFVFSDVIKRKRRTYIETI